jgi:hypothetical protein
MTPIIRHPDGTNGRLGSLLSGGYQEALHLGHAVLVGHHLSVQMDGSVDGRRTKVLHR